MSAFDDPRPLDLDVLLATIYAVQTDLKMLVEHLARERNPGVSHPEILALAYLREQLQHHTLSGMRH